MDAPRLSVVVVSAGRPRALARCLTALGQLRSTRVEAIVVADAPGLAVARAHPLADRLVLLPQGEENISAARNAGIAAAAGEVVAFVDDDAVPEPGWAEAILAGFDDPQVMAATGPVIGRNGFSLQWGRMAVDATGRDRWLAADETPGPAEAPKLHGTNMALRRDCVTRTGGFDTGFRFYLDETDLALRLHRAGDRMAWLPGAVVHHGFAASRRRTEDRVPLDLFDVGASTALFLRKHAPDALEPALSQLEADQRARLLRLARRRRLGAREMRALMESLAAGIAEGRGRDSAVPALSPSDRPFLPLRRDLPPAMAGLHGWRHRAGALRAEAAARVAEGQPVALVLLDPTPRKHRLSFTEGGWWEQMGGLYGPSDRAGPRLQPWRYRSRTAAELRRWAM
ncbi:glycosyltransferase family 2 protein [Roseicyclus persicicus]|uniref:Glycosyltransferase n=1 Tax=Roseicyclus persicicus TaxID=2650661 RepID=A0A7X6H1I1_9RHOB|nr:glycosyltransferase [Roseibacterium persicicum]NKX45116.1 glycosyltransferase [Roseibacterium persicicum]